MRALLSSAPYTSRPIGVNATALTASFDRGIRAGLAVPSVHTRTDTSMPADATSLPSRSMSRSFDAGGITDQVVRLAVGERMDEMSRIAARRDHELASGVSKTSRVTSV